MPRLLRRILLSCLAFVALCILALTVLAYAYQDEVRDKLVAELNSHLKVPVQQSGIELTLIKRFPLASLRIHDVFVKEVRTDSLPSDTLLYAKDLYVEFSLLSLFSRDYAISQLHGEDVRLYPGLDVNGAENWMIWRADSTASSANDFKLKKVTFDGLYARYRDARSRLEIRSSSEKLAMRGRFRTEGSSMSINGDLFLDHWSDAKGVQLSDRKAEVKLRLAFGGADGAFRIEKGSEVLLGEDPISVALAVERDSKGRTLDLRASGFNMALSDVVALLPDDLHKRVAHYDLRGEADVAVHYAGPLGGEGPALSVGMTVRKGRLKEHSSGTEFKAVHGDLALELTPQGNLRKLVVKGLKAQAASGNLNADLELIGTTNATLKAAVHGDLAVADLLRFARVDTLEEAEGRLILDARATGKLRDVAHWKAADLRALSMSGMAELKDASLKLKGVRHRVTSLNATLALQGNDATVHGLRCEVQGSPIELNGTLRNLVPYLLFPDQRLVIDARGSSPRLDLAALLSTNAVSAGDHTTANTDYTVKLPSQIDLDLRTTVDELVFEDFSAQKIACTITLKDQVLRVSPLTFNSAEGAVVGDLELDGRPGNAYPLVIAANVKGMDIKRLFHEFRNFGQTFITDAHLKGRGDVRLTFNGSLSPQLKLDQNSLHCIADISIAQGELNGHAPMMAVADFLRTNKLVSPFVDTDELRKRLAHVSFALLENQIEIKDRTVLVPSMTVKSSAMDIELSGAQTFDGGVDDHLSFRLGDLFKLGEQNDEFGPVVDDGTGLRVFLHMFGTTQDLRFGNDGAAAAARRKGKLKQESTELKSLLSDIWHGKGEAPNTTTTSAPVFTIEPTSADSTDTRSGTHPRKKGLGRLLDGAAKDEEQETITIE